MTSRNVILQNTLLQEMVKVKKLRFKDIEERRYIPRVTEDIRQRRANFEEFKAVYEDNVSRQSSLSLSEDPYVLHKTKSGSFCRSPSVKKEHQYVETVNIELPLHFGADRAVQVIGNKIQPKRASNKPKISRQIVTEHAVHQNFNIHQAANKPKKSVTIIDKLTTIEESAHIEDESLTNVTKRQLKEIQKHLKVRKDRIHKTLPKPLPVIKVAKKKVTKDKIMTTLSNINEKLQKMQEKYFNIPRIHYKNVDCFTQSEDLEVLYENQKYPENINLGDVAYKSDLLKFSDNLFSDSKMQERIKEMNDMFPEFPKIEDTLREIEGHLDNIVKLERSTSSRRADFNDLSEDRVTAEIAKMWNGGNLTEILETLDKDSHLKNVMTDEILKKRQRAKDEKLRSIRQQIDEIEKFCDRLSEISNDEAVDVEKVSDAITAINEEDEFSSPGCCQKKEDSTPERKKSPEITDFIEGPELQSSIKKSSYLSKEFSEVDKYAPQPMIKIFSENRRSLWRDRIKDMKKQNEDHSVESVTKMIDSLKFTLENSIYEPVA